MEIRKVEFTHEELQNLATFLDRVQTTGVLEALALTQIAKKINEPVLGDLTGTKVEKEVKK